MFYYKMFSNKYYIHVYIYLSKLVTTCSLKKQKQIENVLVTQVTPLTIMIAML